MSHLVNPPLHKLQQHVDSIHVDAHVLNGVRLDFGDQQYIQTGQWQVTKQINGVAVESGGSSQ